MAFPKENACDRYNCSCWLGVSNAYYNQGSVIGKCVRFPWMCSKALEAENFLIYTTAGPRGEWHHISQQHAQQHAQQLQNLVLIEWCV